MPTQLIILLIACAISAASGFGGAWKLQALRHDSAMLKIQQAADTEKEAQLETDRLRRVHVATAAQGHEDDKVEIETVFKTITKEVQNEIIKYRDSPVCLSDSSLLIVAKAVAATAPSSAPGGIAGNPVPAASAPK